MFGEITPQERAAWTLRTAIRRVAQEVYGAEVVEEPIEGFKILTKSTLDDPLAGIRAAVLARDIAVGQMLTYAEEARGAGRSWNGVAEALGIESREGDTPRGELAFLLVVESRPLPTEERSWCDRAAASWTCSSCGQRITDHGPFESHPDDNERGHTPSCIRLATALATRAND